MEQIIGTAADRTDTDGDGVPDGTELRNGSNPLDGIPVATGMIASVATPGGAGDIVVLGDIAAVSDGNQGLALIDVSNPFAPVHLSQVRLGTSLLLAGAGNEVMAAFSSRIAFVAITNATEPRVTHLTNAAPGPTALAMSGVYGYASLNDGRVRKIDPRSGEVVWEWFVGRGVLTLSFSRGLLFVRTAAAVHVLRDSLQGPEVVGTVDLSSPEPGGDGGRFTRTAVGGGLVYAANAAGYSVININHPACRKSSTSLRQGSRIFLGSRPPAPG